MLAALALWAAITFPAVPYPVTGALVEHESYAAYVDARGCPLWVQYTLSAADLTGEPRFRGSFRPDPLMPDWLQVRSSDYLRSGKDRGHLKAAADEPGSRETFWTSNVCPQSPRLNRGRWRQLEEHTRMLAHGYGEMVVIVGPIWGKGRVRRFRTIGASHVWVPTHYFRVVYAPATGEVWAWVLPNRKVWRGLDYHRVALGEVEEWAGLDLLGAP